MECFKKKLTYKFYFTILFPNRKMDLNLGTESDCQDKHRLKNISKASMTELQQAKTFDRAFSQGVLYIIFHTMRNHPQWKTSLDDCRDEAKAL